MSELTKIAESFGCTADSAGTVFRFNGAGRDIPIGTVRLLNGGPHGHYEAQRADGGFISQHRTAELAVLALLTTFYTPARGQ